MIAPPHLPPFGRCRFFFFLSPAHPGTTSLLPPHRRRYALRLPERRVPAQCGLINVDAPVNPTDLAYLKRFKISSTLSAASTSPIVDLVDFVDPLDLVDFERRPH